MTRIEPIWRREDNYVQFESDGLQCVMCRGPLGAWCGYVAIPKTHPLYGKEYSNEIKPTREMLENRHTLDHGPIDLLVALFSDKDLSESCSISLAIRVHGGLTYSADHKPYDEPDGNWWFGFDCAHAGDYIPGMEKYVSHHSGDVYRDQQYVVAETQSLAKQLKDLESLKI